MPEFNSSKHATLNVNEIENDLTKVFDHSNALPHVVKQYVAEQRFAGRMMDLANVDTNELLEHTDENTQHQRAVYQHSVAPSIDTFIEKVNALAMPQSADWVQQQEAEHDAHIALRNEAFDRLGQADALMADIKLEFNL